MLPAAHARLAPPDFTLGERFTDAQRAWFETHGFIRFRGFLPRAAARALADEVDALSARFVAEERSAVHGVPLIVGTRADGTRYVQRFAFASLFGAGLHAYLQDPRLGAIVALLGPGYRIGEHERDGLVVNHYRREPGSRYSSLGWHTDSLRDAFSPGDSHPDLNVGLYLDDSPLEKGGLRLIPGSHRQGRWAQLTRKPFFVDCTPDPDEVAVVAEAGDLTVHDGRLWHRVAPATVEGDASARRVAYFHVTWPRQHGLDALDPASPEARARNPLHGARIWAHGLATRRRPR